MRDGICLQRNSHLTLKIVNTIDQPSKCCLENLRLPLYSSTSAINFVRMSDYVTDDLQRHRAKASYTFSMGFRSSQVRCL